MIFKTNGDDYNKKRIAFCRNNGGSSVLKDRTIVEKFIEEYKKATIWCMAHPEETAKLVVKHIPQLNEKGVAEAMGNVTLRADDAVSIKAELESFFCSS